MLCGGDTRAKRCMGASECVCVLVSTICLCLLRLMKICWRVFAFFHVLTCFICVTFAFVFSPLFYFPSSLLLLVSFVVSNRMR